jgi:ribosomal protein S18 acetylase RimI-like enzyme
MLGATSIDEPPTRFNGMRPVNLRTDLAPLADLIELVFADSMDSSGRAALREMRYLSRMGPGLNVIAHMNDMAMGLNLGYVWLADGQLVGNVSVYPAHWPTDLGRAWIIANVGVHPDYQRRGIARRLMQASMEMIARRGGTAAILQVDVDNTPALYLYQSLGFVIERAWSVWRRRPSTRFGPPPPETNVYMRHRRRSEWRQEMALAQRIRPQEGGGLGWLRPLHKSQFRKSLWSLMGDWISLRGVERLVLVDDHNHIMGSLWIETGFGSKTRLMLLVEPDHQGIYDHVLLDSVVRRMDRTPLLLELPQDDTVTTELLHKYHFTCQRTVTHMRWDAG